MPANWLQHIGYNLLTAILLLWPSKHDSKSNAFSLGKQYNRFISMTWSYIRQWHVILSLCLTLKTKLHFGIVLEDGMLYFAQFISIQQHSVCQIVHHPSIAPIWAQVLNLPLEGNDSDVILCIHSRWLFGWPSLHCHQAHWSHCQVLSLKPGLSLLSIRDSA